MVSTPLAWSPESPAVRRCFVVVLVLLFAALAARQVSKALEEHSKQQAAAGEPAKQTRSAFLRWREQLQHLGEVDISGRFNYPNPPVMAVLLEPLAKLPPLAGALLWFCLEAGMALLVLHWVFRLVQTDEAPFPTWARAVVVLLALKPFVDELSHGHVNLFILLLVIAALTAFRRRLDVLAGLLLALAIACKVTPALFLPYFLWKRSWRVLAGCVAGLLLFLWPGLVPAGRLGWEMNQRQLASWYGNMVHPFLVEGKVTSEHVNQSLPGLVFRLGTHHPSFVVFENDVETPSRYDNLLDLTPAQAKWLVKGCMALFALAVVLWCRSSTQQRQGWPLAGEFAVVLLGMLLFSERTWKHHCVTLVLPFSVLVYYLARGGGSAWLRRVLATALVAALALLVAPGLTTGRGRAIAAADPGLGKLALVYGSYTIACLVLLAGLLLILRRAGASPASACIPPAEGAKQAA